MKLIGLDVGTKRIGVARADSSVKIAVPVGMIEVDGNEFNQLAKMSRVYGTNFFVVGLPRNNQGLETAQSKLVREFVENLKKTVPNAKIKFQDESLTSVQAEENLRNKKGGINKKAGDVDTEAATLILQDFLESFSARATQSSSEPALKPYSDPKSPQNAKERPLIGKPYKKNYKKWLIIRIFCIFLIIFGLLFIVAKIWYSSSLKSPVSFDCASSEYSSLDECKIVEFSVNEGDSVSVIADNLAEKGLIKSSLAFKIYVKLNNFSNQLKAGNYDLRKNFSVEKITQLFVDGTTNAVVFRLTTLPGETLTNIKSRLLSIGYDETEIDAALSKNYNHPILDGKPEDKNLEGYLYGETYEFYQSDPVEKIVTTMLDELTSVVSKNNLKSKFESRGLTLYQGIILASIIQKEAGNLSLEEQKNVASVFYNRLDLGMALGSDVTVTYALSQLSDSEREAYSDNAAKLGIDSCYNTRKYTGLPCGPISNPGAFALIAAANPSETDYLYFLTGDDGLMYYSTTDSGHLQNIRDHCQELCNSEL